MYVLQCISQQTCDEVSCVWLFCCISLPACLCLPLTRGPACASVCMQPGVSHTSEHMLICKPYCLIDKGTSPDLLPKKTLVTKLSQIIKLTPTVPCLSCCRLTAENTALKSSLASLSQAAAAGTPSRPPTDDQTAPPAEVGVLLANWDMHQHSVCRRDWCG